MSTAQVSRDVQQARCARRAWTPLAVEMEGAAVAQVCHDYGMPFAAVRTISDRADDIAHVDFQHFVTMWPAVYARASWPLHARLLPTRLTVGTGPPRRRLLQPAARRKYHIGTMALATISTSAYG
jgi:hypothetical protein